MELWQGTGERVQKRATNPTKCKDCALEYTEDETFVQILCTGQARSAAVKCIVLTVEQ
jgi:hypothetical protein